MASVAKRTWTYKGETKTAWVVRYTDQLGKRRLKTFDMKKEAGKYRTKVELEIEKGVHTADTASITVRDAAKQYLRHVENRVREGELCEGSYRNYKTIIKNRILPQFGTIKLTALNAPAIHRWIEDMRYGGAKPIGPRALVLTVLVLRLMIGLAQRHGQIATNVMVDARPDLPRPTRKELAIPTKNEVRLLLSQATGYFKIMLHMAVLTGMRQGELRGLLWKDVDFQNQTIHVRRSIDQFQIFGSPKSEAGVRDIPMAPTVLRMLKEWRLASPNTELGLVFCNGKRLPLHQSQLYRFAWRPLLRKVNFVDKDGGLKYRFHALRHVAASMLIEQGEQPKVIQEIMGHASITMTYDTYGHLFDKANAGRDALAAIDKSLLG